MGRGRQCNSLKGSGPSRHCRNAALRCAVLYCAGVLPSTLQTRPACHPAAPQRLAFQSVYNKGRPITCKRFTHPQGRAVGAAVKREAAAAVGGGALQHFAVPNQLHLAALQVSSAQGHSRQGIGAGTGLSGLSGLGSGGSWGRSGGHRSRRWGRLRCRGR